MLSKIDLKLWNFLKQVSDKSCKRLKSYWRYSEKENPGNTQILHLQESQEFLQAISNFHAAVGLESMQQFLGNCFGHIHFISLYSYTFNFNPVNFSLTKRGEI